MYVCSLSQNSPFHQAVTKSLPPDRLEGSPILAGMAADAHGAGAAQCGGAHRGAGEMLEMCDARSARGCQRKILSRLVTWCALVLLLLPAGRSSPAQGMATRAPGERGRSVGPLPGHTHVLSRMPATAAGPTDSLPLSAARASACRHRLFESESSWQDYQKLVPPRRHAGAGDAEVASLPWRDGANLR